MASKSHDRTGQATICTGFDVCAYALFFAYTAQRHLETLLKNEELTKEVRVLEYPGISHASILRILSIL